MTDVKCFLYENFESINSSEIYFRPINKEQLPESKLFFVFWILPTTRLPQCSNCSKPAMGCGRAIGAHVAMVIAQLFFSGWVRYSVVHTLVNMLCN